MGFKIEAHRNKDLAPNTSGIENSIQAGVMDVSCDVGQCQKPYNCLDYQLICVRCKTQTIFLWNISVCVVIKCFEGGYELGTSHVIFIYRKREESICGNTESLKCLQC